MAEKQVRTCKKHGEMVHYWLVTKKTGRGRWRCRRCEGEAVLKRKQRVRRVLILEAGPNYFLGLDNPDDDQLGSVFSNDELKPELDVATLKYPWFSSIEYWFKTWPGTVPVASYLTVDPLTLIRCNTVPDWPSQIGCVRKMWVSET